MIKITSLLLCFFAFITLLSAQKKVDHGVSKDTVGVIYLVEEQAKFNGGSWKSYLQKNLKVPEQWMNSFPKIKKDTLITQSVEVQFIVCVDGSLCEFKVLNNVHPALAEESIRVIKKSSGMWEAGMQSGQKVKSYHVQKITYVTTGD